jgi:membrane associated rhomboid family serine protease
VLPIPIGDYPNPPRPQWITRLIVAVNVAVHLFVSAPLSRQQADFKDPETRRLVAESRPDADARQLSRYEVLTTKYGYRPGKPDLLSLLTCMFLHGDFMHLFGNMLFLWIFGDNVEARLGRLGYLAAYLATGVVATLSFAVLAGDSMVPLVGASGAISGVLGFYLVWFPYNQVRMLLIFVFLHVFYIRAVWVLGIYLVVQNLLPFLAQPEVGGGGVAYGAHIGGFLAGMAGALAVNLLRGAHPAPRPHAQHERARWGTAEARTIVHRPVEDPSATFANAVRGGNMADAAYAFARIAREGGGGGAPPRPGGGGPGGARGGGRTRGPAPRRPTHPRYYIRNFPRGPDLDRVHLGLGILLARRLGQPAAAREHLHAAIDLGDPTVAAKAREELARL